MDLFLIVCTIYIAIVCLVYEFVIKNGIFCPIHGNTRMDRRSPASGTSDGRRQNVDNSPQNRPAQTRDYHDLIRRVCNLLLTSKTDYKVRAEIAAELKVLVEENVKSKRTFMTVRTLLNKLQVKLQLASQDRMMTPIYTVSMRELSDECRRVMEQMELFGTDHGTNNEPTSAASSSVSQENELKTLLKSEREKNADLEKKLKDVQTSYNTEILKLADVTEELEEERNKKLALSSRLYSELNDRNVEIRKLRSQLEWFQLPSAGQASKTTTAGAAAVRPDVATALKQVPEKTTTDKNYKSSDYYEKENARLTSRNRELAFRIQFLEEKIGNYQSQARRETLAAGPTIPELEDKLFRKEEALVAAQSKITELRGRLRRNNQVRETNRNTASCSGWTNPAPQIPESHQSAQHELDQLHAEIQDKEDEIQVLRAQLESCQLALQDCESKFNVQEEGACELTADNVKFKTEIDQLHVALINKSRECYEVQTALAQANEALRSLSSSQNMNN